MPARLTTLLCLLLVLMVRPGQAQDSVAFEGTAILMTRIAIPADATLVVEAASQESGKPLAEQRMRDFIARNPKERHGTHRYTRVWRPAAGSGGGVQCR